MKGVSFVDGKQETSLPCKLSPSHVVDQVWHSFLLMPGEYMNFCEHVLGPKAVLAHDPEGALHSEQVKDRRYQVHT